MLKTDWNIDPLLYFCKLCVLVDCLILMVIKRMQLKGGRSATSHQAFFRDWNLCKSLRLAQQIFLPTTAVQLEEIPIFGEVALC